MFVGRIARFPVKCLSSQTETWSEIANSKEGSHFLFRHSLIINWVNSILSITFSRLQLAAQKLLVWMYYILEVHHVMQPTLSFHSLGDLSTSTLIIKSALSICYFSLDSWNERSNKRNGKVIPHVITSLRSSLGILRKPRARDSTFRPNSYKEAGYDFIVPSWVYLNSSLSKKDFESAIFSSSNPESF